MFALASPQTLGQSGRTCPLRVLITGGGPGGHVYPGLAGAAALRDGSIAVEVRFAGTSRGLEAVAVPRAGFFLFTVPASGLRGLGLLGGLRFVVNFCAGLVRSLGLLLRWRPAVVLGTGGYVSAPVVLAARLLGIRCALQEQNAMPGSTNRLVARWAQRIYLGFGSAARYFAGRQCLETGNPVRAAFRDGRETAVADETPPQPATEDQHALRLLVFGGSRGARTLNQAVTEAAERWRDVPQLALWLQTGEEDYPSVAAAYSAYPAERVRITPFIHGMHAALRWADLVVCRAGAMTLAELQVVGRPAVLVPFPHATDDHQRANARDLAAVGAARVVNDEDCNGQTLVREVDQLRRDRQQLQRMGRAAAELGRPRAAQTIADDVLRLAGVAEPTRAAEANDVS